MQVSLFLVKWQMFDTSAEQEWEIKKKLQSNEEQSSMIVFFNDMTSPILNYTYLRKKSQITNFRKHIHTQDVTSIMVPGFYSVCQLLFLDKQIEVNHNFYNSSDSITIYRSLKCVENRKKVMYFRNKITKN